MHRPADTRHLNNTCPRAQAASRELEVARLQQERDAARQQLAERGGALAAACDESARLRRALLDAELDTERSSAAAEAAAARLKEVESDTARLRSQVAGLMSEVEAERARARAAAEEARLRAEEAARACATAAAAESGAAAARAVCQGCAEREGRLEEARGSAARTEARCAALEAAVEEHRSGAQVGSGRGPGLWSPPVHTKKRESHPRWITPEKNSGLALVPLPHARPSPSA
jgi:DNA repair exonuclease SbcCD ATPase subunit